MSKTTPNMIYSKGKRIPIGQAATENGQYGLVVKRGSEREFIPLMDLFYDTLDMVKNKSNLQNSPGEEFAQ